MTYINVNQIYDLSIFFILNSFNYFIFLFSIFTKNIKSANEHVRFKKDSSMH